MCDLRAGDTVTAVAGTTSALWAEGRTGVIAEVRDPKPYSGNDSKNLVRWGDETILVGFRPDEVEKVYHNA
jgi:hypothetical protein